MRADILKTAYNYQMNLALDDILGNISRYKDKTIGEEELDKSLDKDCHVAVYYFSLCYVRGITLDGLEDFKKCNFENIDIRNILDKSENVEKFIFEVNNVVKNISYLKTMEKCYKVINNLLAIEKNEFACVLMKQFQDHCSLVI